MSGHAPQNGSPCPLCGAAAPQIPVRAHGEYRLLDCTACGAGYCLPFKNPGPEYYEHHPVTYGVNIERAPDPMSFEYREALARLRQNLPPGARLLDVGCGAGGFLHAARDAGFSAAGLDFNSARAAALRGAGFDVFHGDLIAFARTSPAPFDAITLFQVIEHVDNPGLWLDTTRSLLKPGGIFILGTPNRHRTFDPFQGPGLGHIDNPPHHLTRWSADALARLLERHGFSVIECRPLGYPLALLRLMVRNKVRFGLAERASTAPGTPAPEATHALPAASRGTVLRALVAAKEALLDLSTAAAYPFFAAAYRLFGWEGVPLFVLARPKNARN